jgi:hypothetical protein
MATQTNRTEWRARCRELALAVFRRKAVMQPDGHAATLLKAAVLMHELQLFFRDERASKVECLLRQVEELSEALSSDDPDHEELRDYFAQSALHLAYLRTEPEPERAAWHSRAVSEATRAIPGMNRRDTMKYYGWLGSRVSGAGAVVELGCWLGQSTAALAEGLAGNASYAGRKLHVLDKFEWDEWLSDYADRFGPEFSPETRRLLSPLKVGDSYLHVFLAFCGAHRELVEPRACYLYREGETGPLTPLTWTGGPIELLVNDVGNASALIGRVWSIFAPSFIPGRTVVVMHQYGSARAEALRAFTREHAAELQPIHKPYGSAKGFLYTGQRTA